MEISFVLTDDHLLWLGIFVGGPLYLVIGSAMAALTGWLVGREKFTHEGEDDCVTGWMIMCWPILPLVGLAMVLIFAPIRLSYWLYNPFTDEDRSKS